MTDEEFQIFLDTCFEELEIKQQKLIEEFNIGSFQKFEFDFEKAEIYFLNEGLVEVQANIIPIGSFNSENNTWMWAWANEGFPEDLRAKSARLKQLEEKTGFEIFGTEMPEIDEDMAWEMAGISLNMLNVQGVYRGPVNKTEYFYAIDNVHHVRS